MKKNELLEKELKFSQKASMIQASLGFFHRKAEEIINQLEKLEKKEGWRPDFDERQQELVNKLIIIANRINFEGEQASNLDAEIELFFYCQNHKIEIEYNPNK